STAARAGQQGVNSIWVEDGAPPTCTCTLPSVGVVARKVIVAIGGPASVTVPALGRHLPCVNVTPLIVTAVVVVPSATMPLPLTVNAPMAMVRVPVKWLVPDARSTPIVNVGARSAPPTESVTWPV